MNSIELKNNFHKLIDELNNDLILSKFYNILSKIQNSTEGALWNQLTEDEQEELMISDNESEDFDNLIPHSEIIKRYFK